MTNQLDAIKQYFDLPELVCMEVYNKYGDAAWGFFDPRLLWDLLYIRKGIAKPIFVNSWQIGGSYSQRGLRCNLCDLVAAQTRKRSVYLSAHQQGMAVDFTVNGMSAEEARNWIKAHALLLPYPCRLEADVNWVHLDVRNDGAKGNVITFKA